MKIRCLMVAIATLAGLTQLPPHVFAQTSSALIRDSFQERLAPIVADTFPLTSLAECDEQGVIYHSAELNISVKGSGLLVEGRDATNRAWRVQAPVTGMGCKIFQADLDGNGKTDLIVHSFGITSNAPYDSELTILLFDRMGRPLPWSTTGRYDLNTNGIRQITRSPDQTALVLHTYTVGLPMWGGVSYVARLYTVGNVAIKSIDGPTLGISFPLVMGYQGTQQRALDAVGSVNLSLSKASMDGALKQGGHPLFVRYGAEASLASTTSNVHISPEQGANVTIDTSALDAGKEHIVLSDNTHLEIPSILIVDPANGERDITVRPDAEDLTKLQSRSYEMLAYGTDCNGLNDCRPFVVQASERKK